MPNPCFHLLSLHVDGKGLGLIPGVSRDLVSSSQLRKVVLALAQSGGYHLDFVHVHMISGRIYSVRKFEA